MSLHPEDHLRRLGLSLPDPPKPVGAYVPAVRSGPFLFVSGMIPMISGEVIYKGRIGEALSLEQGQEAARLALLNALSVIREALGGLDRIGRIVRLTGYVSSASGFTQQAQVLNAASGLLVEVFGETGRHARSAIGAAVLPLDAAVELELIVTVNETPS